MLQKEVSENQSELMMKDREVLKLKENNKLLAKQFREKKEFQRKRQVFSQVISGCYGHVIIYT